MIRSATIRDVPELAQIHLQALKGEFLVRLGDEFLQTLYRDFLLQKQTIIYLMEENEIEGFIFGSLDFPVLLRAVLSSRFFRYLLLVAKQGLRSPRLIVEGASTLLFSFLSEAQSTKAELAVIAVKQEQQRRNIGSQLLKVFEASLKKQGIDFYQVSCTQANRKANHFYRKHSFEKSGEFSLYFKRWNRYVKHL